MMKLLSRLFKSDEPSVPPWPRQAEYDALVLEIARSGKPVSDRLKRKTYCQSKGTTRWHWASSAWEHDLPRTTDAKLNSFARCQNCLQEFQLVRVRGMCGTPDKIEWLTPESVYQYRTQWGQCDQPGRKRVEYEDTDYFEYE